MADRSNRIYNRNQQEEWNGPRNEGGHSASEEAYSQRNIRNSASSSRRRRRRTRSSHVHPQPREREPQTNWENAVGVQMAERRETVMSDVATVNSGSEVEDFDIESIRSRDSNRINVAATRATTATQSLADQGSSTSNVSPSGQQPGTTNESRLNETSSNTSEDKKPKAQENTASAIDQPTTASVSSSRSVARAAADLSLQQDPGPMTLKHGTRIQDSKHDEESASSLEVEVNSTASHNSLSYDERTQGSGESTSNRVIDSNPPSGRRSPGGTLYIGRGARRYQGRYISVALRRYHQDGVDPDSLEHVDEGALEEHSTENIYDERRQTSRRGRRREPMPELRPLDRTRSRSRSPNS